MTSRPIKTTHVGSLPRPDALLPLLDARDNNRLVDETGLVTAVRRSVHDIVARQVAAGIDIVNDGEHSKSNFAAYARMRIGGIEETADGFRQRQRTRDAMAFPDVYDEAERMYPCRYGHARPRQRIPGAACTGKLSYIGHAALAEDIRNLKGAMSEAGALEGFMTAISPSNLELYFPNRFYASDEEYLEALADVMHVEYKAIVDAGFVLQVDDPRLATHYDRHPEASVEDCRRFMALRIEAVNHALRGIPEERVRFHTCYSVNVAPRVHDLGLEHYVDLLLRIRAAGYSLEAANPRHEHEWQVWEDVKLPDGKVLLPGVVSHCVHIVEHPALVAQRIQRFCDVVGRERVIASSDCGFATSAAADEVHPDVAWAKLQALSQGARLASERAG